MNPKICKKYVKTLAKRYRILLDPKDPIKSLFDNFYLIEWEKLKIQQEFLNLVQYMKICYSFNCLDCGEPVVFFSKEKGINFSAVQRVYRGEYRIEGTTQYIICNNCGTIPF